MGNRPNHPLITANWPMPEAQVDAESSAQINWLVAVIKEVRSARTELGIKPGDKLIAHFPTSLQPRVNAGYQALLRIARLQDVRFDPAPAGASAQLVVEGETITVPLEGVIDIAAERDRLTKALAAAAKERDGLAGRLNNPSFVERAKPEAVEKARADHAAKEAEADRLTAALARLG